MAPFVVPALAGPKCRLKAGRQTRDWDCGFAGGVTNIALRHEMCHPVRVFTIMSKRKRKHRHRPGGSGGPGTPRAPIYQAQKPPVKRTNHKAWIITAVIVLVGIVAYAKF